MAVRKILIGNVKGPKGDKGDKPVKGTDYFTEEEKAEMVSEVGNGLPDWSGGIEGVKKALNGVARKVAALAGFTDARLKEHDAGFSRRRVTVYSTTDTMIRFNCSTGDNSRECSLSLASSKYLYTISQIGEFNVNNLSSATSANKTLIGLWVDGTRYDTVDVLKTVGFSFDNMVLMYTVTETDYTINTCVCLSADGIEFYESIPEPGFEDKLNKTLIEDFSSGATVTPIMDMGTNVRIFSIKNGDRFYVEKMEDFGRTVVKTIAFNGRL